MSGEGAAGAYHRRSSHRLDGYARGPETLDWTSQPAPFRNFADAPQVPLPLLQLRDDAPGSAPEPAPEYARLFEPDAITPAPMTLASVAALFELSLGISAWKSWMGDSWALRCNPSSGNLHPTEGYLVAAAIDGLEDGVYHYRPDEHQLEWRAAIPFTDETASEPRLIIGLSSILWREAWKYGERAFRYCQLDIGHAVAAFAYAAATLGWRLHLLDHHSSDEVAALLGLDDAASFAEAEPEEAELLFELTPRRTTEPIPEAWFALASAATWTGRANRIDPHPYGRWPVVGEIARATRRGQRTALRPADTAATVNREIPPAADGTAAARLIRQRRSAQHFDGRVMMPLQHFLQILDATLPRAGLPPWPANGAACATHLLLFVHRVAGLRQGLYALPRSSAGLGLMQAEMNQPFQWQRVAAAERLPLYLLIHADSRNAARMLSCHQPIAGDSSFAVSMLGEFERRVGEGQANYRQLFIEAGQIGQALYLEAEQCGFRGTGIGCYFDPAVHETFGVEGGRLQSIYHFTVGMPLVDERIQTSPPYAHLKERRAG